MTATPPDLPVDLRSLAAVDLVGAQVQDWRLERDSFSWTLLVGDADRGHELVAITYVGAVVLHVNRREKAAAVARRLGLLSRDERGGTDGAARAAVDLAGTGRRATGQ